MKELVIVLMFLILIVTLLAIAPLAFLWSVNSLFGLAIPYTLHSFLAAWVLLAVVRLVTRTEVPKKD